jgi:hypothetical protein
MLRNVSRLLPAGGMLTLLAVVAIPKHISTAASKLACRLHTYQRAADCGPEQADSPMVWPVVTRLDAAAAVCWFGLGVGVLQTRQTELSRIAHVSLSAGWASVVGPAAGYTELP